ncbi:MAG: hypothetical protein LZF62_240224 [Nitrospira sp.]|nr:MAG: hypothetical protein LZF62_240224 [Nitrospira sp.]
MGEHLSAFPGVWTPRDDGPEHCRTHAVRVAGYFDAEWMNNVCDTAASAGRLLLEQHSVGSSRALRTPSVQERCRGS